ncbi:hypothetical protein GUJ93_ZPchr0006g42051 [Zizania palustris]|uniref:Uncharacterized protein n=1 Tax=Zizania palustris TaxID=103762 RepID=A0A8J5VU29_ZIZPA|nr:hypothetical protein GUJ93_ZPchr0006g42051 [Zizania palustris]
MVADTGGYPLGCRRNGVERGGGTIGVAASWDGGALVEGTVANAVAGDLPRRDQWSEPQDLTRREGWGRAAMWLEMRLNSAVFQLTPTRTSTSYELITSFCRSLHISRCYAWEQSFQSKVQDIRNDELSWFRRAQLLAAISYWLKRDYFYPIHLSILSFQQVLLRMDIFHGNNRYGSRNLFAPIKVNLHFSLSRSGIISLDRAEAVIEITEWVEVPKKNLTLESNSTGQNLSKEAGSANGTSDSKENLSSDSDADKSRTPIDKNNAQDIIMEKVLKKRTFRVPLKLVEKAAGAGSILSKESYSEAKTRLSELKDRPAACENARLYLVELQKIVKNLESNKPWLPREGSHTEKYPYLQPTCFHIRRSLPESSGPTR